VIAAQSPQQPIEDREAFAIVVQDGRLRQLDEFGRHAERASGTSGNGDVSGATQSGSSPATFQVTSAGRTSLRTSAPRGPTPAFEIGFAIKRDEMHLSPLLFVGSLSSAFSFRHCEPPVRPQAGPMTGFAKQSRVPHTILGLLRRSAPRNDGETRNDGHLITKTQIPIARLSA